MNILWSIVNLLLCTQFVVCRDFYMGMFKRNDFLVAQDVIYKEASHFGYTTASYGRLFKCPISYFRVVDRLGMGKGPYTSIVRGGLRKKYIAVRIKSTYNLPISVNIYVGCENKAPSTVMRLTTKHVDTRSTLEIETTIADGVNGSVNDTDENEIKDDTVTTATEAEAETVVETVAER